MKIIEIDEGIIKKRKLMKWERNNNIKEIVEGKGWDTRGKVTEWKISHHIIILPFIWCHIIFTSYHMISYHIISYHIMSYHIISYHIISYHIISNQIKSYHIISYHITGFKNPLNMMTITPLNKHSTNLHELNKIFLWPAKTIFSANFPSEKYGK